MRLIPCLLSLGSFFCCGAVAAQENARPVAGSPQAPPASQSADAGNLPASPAAPRIVGERRVALLIDSGGAEVAVIYGWVSTDRGASWKGIGHSTEIKPPTFRYDAPEDGRYDFYFVLENSAGRSGQPPTSGALPHATVLVDTNEPIVQLHGVAREPDLPRTWRFRASVLDENLGANGIRIFYRGGASDMWRDGGPGSYAGGSLLWTATEELPERFDVRVVATDRAGHRGMADLTGILVPLREARRPAASQPAVELAAAKTSAPMAKTPSQPPVPATRPSLEPKGLDPETARLQELAVYFRERGQFDVAAARLASALERAPDNIDLLTTLGGDLAAGQHWADARKRFERARELQPENAAALQGLALVAAQERRYPEAREFLQLLLKQRPDSSADWLRLGDVQFRLGEKPGAIEAWQRAAETAGTDEAALARAKDRIKQFGTATNRP